MIARHRELPSISRRLTLSLILTVAIVSITVIGLNYYSTSRKAKAQLNEKADEYISFLLNSLRIPLWNFEIETIKHIGSVYSQNELIGALRITGSNGEIYFNAEKDDSRPRIRREKTIVYNERSVGTVQLSLTSQTYNIYQKQLLRQSIIAVLGVLIAIIGVTGFFLRTFLKKPLAHLSDLVGAYTSGTFDPATKPQVCREFQEVVEVLGEMSAKIIKQMSELQAAEEKYRSIFENAVEGIFQSTVDGRFISVNPALAHIYGYDSPEEVVTNLTDIRTQLWIDPNRRKELIRLLDENGVVKEFEVEIYRKDKSIAVTSVNARKVHDAKGDMVYLEGSIEDITARKQAEEALRESEAKYRELVQNANSIILRIDTQGNFTFFNEFAEQFFGYTEGEILGKNAVGTIVPETDTFGRNLSAMVEDLAKNPERYVTNENENMRRNGERVWITWANKAIHNEEGNLVEILCIGNDITDRKRLETQLQHAQKMEAVGTLAGGVAHDLNNIFSGLVSYPELLLLDLPEDSPLRQPILRIKESGHKAAAIVQDLLTLARRGVAITEVVNLNDIVSDFLGTPEYDKLKAFHPDVEFKINFASDLLNILGSPVHLAKTVMNLVSNAAEAMPSDGKILISTENQYIDRPIRGYEDVQEGDYVLLSIVDSGIGISPDDLPRIFEPFYTKKVMGRSGTGLGMAVIWGTVKDHNGYIDVQSTVGKGTRCDLYFPVTRREPAEKRVEASIDEFMGGGEILVVDDVEEQRKIAHQILTRLGYSVTTVSSGEEAVEYMQKNSADLLVLDMIMDPGIDGLETYKRILEFHPGQKAIIASGFSETERVKEAQRLGAGAYIKKPYVLEKMGKAVRDELKK